MPLITINFLTNVVFISLYTTQYIVLCVPLYIVLFYD